MGFLSSLRMNNVFNGGMFSPLYGQDRDPYEEIIGDFLRLKQQEQTPVNQPINRPLQQSISRPLFSGNKPMNVEYGGVIPETDSVKESRERSNKLYEDYSKPQITAGEILTKAGIKPNEQFPKIDLEGELNRRLKESQIKENESQAAIAKQNADSKGWTTVTITDPNDPSKQINVRHNNITGEVKPITMPNNGIITNKEKPADIEKRNEERKLKQLQGQAIKDKAQQAMDELDSLFDSKTGRLTSKGQWGVGWSSLGNFIPTSPMLDSSKSINRLKNLLTIDILKELKSQSRTGATGMGNMSNKDLTVLEQAASKLDPNMSEEAFADELGRIKALLHKTIQPDTENIEYKVGDTKIFLNGNKGRWDGTGWELVK